MTMNPSAFWKLDEANGTRLSSIGDYNLSEVGFGSNSVGAGKIGNAPHFTTYERRLVNGNESISDANRSFSIWGWVNSVGSFGEVNIGQNQPRDIFAGFCNNVSSWKLYFKATALGKRLVFSVWNTSGTETSVEAVSFGDLTYGDWVFVHASFNATTKVVSLSVNNGTADTATLSGTPRSPSGSSFVTFGPSNDLSNYKADEFGVNEGVLDATDLAYLYNLGSGVTSPLIVDRAFSASGSSTASIGGTAVKPSAFSSAGQATVSNPGNVNRQSSFASAGVANVSNPGALIRSSAFASAGVATAMMEGASVFRSSFSSAGQATSVMVSGGIVASSFNSQSSSSGNMIGVSTVESAFSSAGQSLAVMFSPSIASSSFLAFGSSLAKMYSPTLTITTLQNGSGGNPDGGAEIDWTLCDFANINLIAGTGSFPIDHVNLIAGKKISVHVHNNVAATGSILWDGGDAPVTWVGMPAPPDMPVNGTTLHVEFECNDDRTEIFGRLFVDEEVREILDGLDRRYGRTLFDHSTNAANVSTTETTLYQDTIVGGTLAQDGDKILAEYAAEFAMSINAKQVLLYFPTSVVIFDTGSLAITATTDCQLRATIIRKTASTARAVVTITTLPVAVGGGNAQITDEATLTGLNFDQDNLLRLAAIGGASDDVIAKLGFGEFKPAAV